MRRATKELLKKVNNFINTIDDFEDVIIGEEFMCLPDSNEIVINATYLNEYDDFYYTLIERIGKTDISTFTWSLLHEVGHCMTFHFLDKRAYNHCQYIKNKIEKGKVASINYYYLADEKRATNWAIKFVKDNYNIVKNFDNIVKELI